jgi:multiple sugar transport system substrate-binding protein
MKKLQQYLNFPVIASFLALSYLLVFEIIDWSNNSDSALKGKVVLSYWEKWSGFELAAMQTLVDDFNKSQNRIYVKLLSVSSIDQKLMLATAGGNPPDVAGLWSHSINVFAGKGALTPLDGLMKRNNITKEQYTPVFWDLCKMYGFTWALPSTPATVALHWNKKIFREAGLDPNTPPRSIAELDTMAEKLTLVEVVRDGKKIKINYPELTDKEKKSRSFTLVRLGFVPSVPGWFNEMWGFWFGAKLWNGTNKITINSPKNITALRWYVSYAEKYGLKNIQSFGSSFGTFASPQDPFLSGRVAMVQQGVWLYNFINMYAPQMEWAAAPLPSIDPVKLPDVTIAECDVLVIPRGVKHVKEAFEFIKYVQQRKNIEKLNLAHRKFSPLSTTSKEFIKDHPNPYIEVFIELSKSPNARPVPRIPVWNEYKTECLVAYDRAFSGILKPETALNKVTKRAQWQLDRVLKRWNMIKADRFREWREIDDSE